MNNTLNTSRCAFSARTTLAAALVALACGGCALDQPLAGLGNIFGAPAEAKSASNTAAGAISGEITPAKALVFIYGGKVVTMSAKDAERIFGTAACSEWVPWMPPAEHLNESMSVDPSLEGKKAAVCKMLDGRYTEGGVEKYMMVTETRYMNDANACKMCGPLVGVFIFAKDSEQWKLEAGDKIASEGGWMGASMLGKKLMRVGSGKYGVLHGSFYNAMGNESIGESVIMPYNGSIRAFHIHTIESTEGAGVPGSESEGDLNISFDESSDGEYYDAIASYTSGVVGKSGNVVKKKKITKRFRFVNGAYEEVKTAKKSSAKKRK